MQARLSLIDLAKKIEEVEAKKRDFIVPSTMMTAVPEENNVALEFRTNGPDSTTRFNLNTLAHEQLSERLEIPRKYYQRMQAEAPELLASNINTWLQKNPERRLVRTYDHNVRAVLSDRYKPRENYALAQVLLPILHNSQGEINVLSSDITERRMYVKVTHRSLEDQLTVIKNGARVGETVNGGILVSNSEVGAGAANISLLIYILSCRNGMVREHSLREIHIGGKLKGGDDEIAFYSREAIEADQRAFMLKVRDALVHAFDKEKFHAEVRKFQLAADNQFNPAQVPQVIENVTAKLNLTKEEGKSIVDRMYQGGDFSQWGISMAITNLANDIENYDRIVDLETAGGQLIDLSKSEWSSITKQ